MDLQFGLAGKATCQGKTYMSCFVNENRDFAYAVDYYNGEVVTIAILKQKIVKVTQTINMKDMDLILNVKVKLIRILLSKHLIRKECLFVI
mgnify:CR=1 FL=1